MLPKIGHLIFHADLYNVCTEVYKEHNNEIAGIEIVQPVSLSEHDILTAARKMEKKCDILITRVDTVELLSEHLSIPVIARSITLANILDALKIARNKKGRRIALVIHHTQDCDLSDWPCVLGIEVAKFFYHSREDAGNAVDEARSFNPDMLLGGGLVTNYASHMQIPYELIKIKKDTIMQSVWKALDIFRATQKDKEYIKEFQHLMDYLHEGFIFLDQNYRITYANNCACEILKTDQSSLLNQNLLHVLHHITSPEGVKTLKSALEKQSKNPYLGLLLSGQEESIVANVIHPSLTDQLNKIIVTFTETTQLQTIEYKIRKQLANKGLVAKFSLSDIIGSSSALNRAKEKVAAFAKTTSTVLLYGETGTGKEMFAHSIHQLSSRANGPFVSVNCSALPKELAESELFGYEEGAFTGAKKAGKPGIFELAHEGTLFLDEIGTMPLELQAKLLRVIQEKEVSRLGGTRIIPVNVRVIAATNNDLELSIQEGLFRRDLYFRLNVLLLHIPTLRERQEDIILLFKHFVQKFALKSQTDINIINECDLSILTNYSWPGNVREIENFAERYVALAASHPAPLFLLEELFNEIKRGLASSREKPPIHNIADINEPTLTEAKFTTERELLIAVGEKVYWNRKKMAQQLNISQATLWRKMKKFIPGKIR